MAGDPRIDTQTPSFEFSPIDGRSLVAQAIERAHQFDLTHPASRFDHYIAATTLPPEGQPVDPASKYLRAIGMHAFLAATTDKDITDLLEFVLGQSEEDIEVVVAGGTKNQESFAHCILRQYSDIVTHLDGVAARLAPKSSLTLRDELLLTANNLLRTAIATQNQFKRSEWEKTPSAQESETFHQQRAALQLSFRLFHDYLLLLQNPTFASQTFNVPNIKEFEGFNDLDNEQRRTVFTVISTYFFKLWSIREERAPYANNSRELAIAFYQQLDLDTTAEHTSDTDLLRSQVVNLAQKLTNLHLIPQPPQLNICSLGIGSGTRVDTTLYDCFVQAGYQPHYIGVDLRRHPNLPSHFGCVTEPIEQIGKITQKFDLIVDFWPGPPIDFGTVHNYQEQFHSISQALAEQGIFVLEFPLPVGRGSVATLIENSFRTHLAQSEAVGAAPTYPPGHIFHEFAGADGEVARGEFLVLDLEKIIALAHGAGLELLNFPASAQERIDLLVAVATDDSFLSRTADVFKMALSQTASGRNRMFLIFIKTSPEQATTIRNRVPTTSLDSYPAARPLPV